MAAIGAAGLMLRFLGLPNAAASIDRAVQAVLEQRIWTPELGGSYTTEEVTSAVLGGVKLSISEYDQLAHR